MTGTTESAALRSSLWRLSDHQIGGHVFDPRDAERRFVVELLIDGAPAALTRAELFDPDLAAQGHGDGCHGFLFGIDVAALQAAQMVEVRLANGGLLGPPLIMRASAPPASAKTAPGSVVWLGGVRLHGRVAVPGSIVRALVDGQVVASARASHWTHVGEGRDAKPAPGFDLALPLRFADGRAHFAQVVDHAGRELEGSPCAFVAFEDGLARFLEQRADLASERLRAENFDKLFPQSLSFKQFAEWRERFPFKAPETKPDAPARIAVALVGEREIEASVASLETQRGCEWVAAALEGGAGETAFPNVLLQDFLDGEARDCEAIVFAPSGALFQPEGLAALAKALELFPAAPSAYCDFTVAAEDGGEWPVALTAFDYERMLEQGAGALVFVLRMEAAKRAAASGAADLFRLFNFSQDGRRARGPRHSDSLAAAAPVHVPGFLARLPQFDLASASRALAGAAEAHLRARGMPAGTEAGVGGLLPVVRVARPAPRGKVSFLIPTRNRLDLLKPCIETLSATVDLGRHELIVLDNDSSDPETLAWLSQMANKGVKVIRIGGTFNFPFILNKGAAAAAGEYLLFLNNDVEALSPGWLEDMLGRMAEPDVGAVGATLLYPSGVVQHGGVTLGPSFDASHAFGERIDGDCGYADLLRVAHEVSAATAACLLTERSLFLEVGGLDGRLFPINYNDVDYCLKLRARGLRVVQTPHAKLLHRESASRGRDAAPDREQRYRRELRNLRAAWGDALAADPYYNPLLSLDNLPFTGLAWPPRPSRPRQNFSPPPRVLPPGF